MLLDLFSLECFISVSQTGSFTKAAKLVYRSQSAVSQQILKIEKSLGVVLFNRRKKLTLTADGERFLSYAKKIYALQREAIDAFKEPDLEGSVRFGLPEDFATVFLSDILAEFIKIHPRVSLHVECDFTLNLLDRFKKDEFDLVLVKTTSRRDFPNGVDIWSERLEWVGNPECLERNDGVPLVLSPPPCVYRARAIHSLNEANMKYNIAFSTHSYTGTTAAVKAGMGITVLPRNMVPEGLHILPPGNKLPKLEDTAISILKSNRSKRAITSLETFILEKMQP